MRIRSHARARPTLIAGRYRVLRTLGRGGMATVHCVHDEVTGHDLALKRLHAEAPASHVALFEREYHTLATLQHPCIVRGFDYGADPDGAFYTMELLSGAEVHDRAPLPYTDVCRMLRDLASGLALLHARRLIHRDLSARNIFLMPDGSVKLIDFGTLAAFGKARNLAGTPPFIAPESLHGGDLDQRTDLYALGALAYYLLTGRHAFPARSVAELSDAWQERPRAASKRVAELERADLPAVPPALDALIESLLDENPLARPTTAADMMDRLAVIAGLPQAEIVQDAESYLASPAFVGRAKQRKLLRDACAAAARSQPRMIVIEAAAGMGRTRLLKELAVTARVQGAIVLEADADAERATHGVAERYAHGLLSALPELALQRAEPYAATLAHLSGSLAERLGVETLSPMPQAHGEARMRVQSALSGMFLDVARDQLIVIIADDVQGFDQASLAWLAALTRSAGHHKLLVVAAIRDSGESLPTPLRLSAEPVRLGPLSRQELSDLFRSVFGDAQHLARLVDLAYQRTEGNPRHALDLLEHLYREGLLSLSQGAWMLPQTIPPEVVPADRVEAERARLARLTSQARALGQSLSVCEGELPLPLCVALSELKRSELFDALDVLVRAGVLAGSTAGYRFARESLRKLLHDELGAERLQLAHARLGSFLLSGSDRSALERLRAGVHLLLGGDEEAGSRLVAEGGRHYGLVELAELGPAAPLLERALAHFRATGRSDYELISLLAPLALAGYYADRVYATLYGREAVSMLERLIGLPEARRLRPYLGRKLGLLAALGGSALAFARHRRNPRVPRYREAIMLLFNCVAALTGTSTICLDPESARAYAAVLEPMAALGSKHVASVMYTFCRNLAATLEDHPARARRNWIAMADMLEQPIAARYLPAGVHALYIGGVWYARGVCECYRDDSAALECADRLQALHLKLYEMSADQVRMFYYASRGDLLRFEQYRQRVEVHAIQRGSAWQVETWTYSGLVSIYLRLGDVAGLRTCAEQLKRLSAETPSLMQAQQRAQQTYLVMRGTPEEALSAVQQSGEHAVDFLGAARHQGLRAAAHNLLGQHERAKQLCEAALARLDPEDLAFCTLNLGLQLELARAEAGLGHAASAEQALRALLVAHAPAANPLSLGALHEALAELAAQRRDADAFVAHEAEVTQLWQPLRVPALEARRNRLARLYQAYGSSGDGVVSRAPDTDTAPRLLTVLHRLRHGGERDSEGSARWALQQLLPLTGAEDAHLFTCQDGELTCVASYGLDEPPALLTAALQKRVQQLGDADSDQTSYQDEPLDPTLITLGARSYRMAVLRSANDNDERIAGVVALAGDGSVPHPVLRAIAKRLFASDSLLPAAAEKGS